MDIFKILLSNFAKSQTYPTPYLGSSPTWFGLWSRRRLNWWLVFATYRFPVEKMAKIALQKKETIDQLLRE